MFRFKNGAEMLKIIQTGVDLYNPRTETYVFLYNEAGIAVYESIGRAEALKIGKQAHEAGDYWSSFLGIGGYIYDDPSYPDKNLDARSNLEWCEDNFSGSWYASDEWFLSNRRNPLFILVGKSGSGKSTVAEALCEKLDMKQIFSCTTRPRRYEDETGYQFITDDMFDVMLPGMFAVTEFAGNRYGVSAAAVEEGNLFIADFSGVRAMKEAGLDRPVVAIYLDVPEEKLKARMKQRGDSAEKILGRIEHDREKFSEKEIACADFCIDASRGINRVIDAVMEIVGGYFEKD